MCALQNQQLITGKFEQDARWGMAAGASVKLGDIRSEELLAEGFDPPVDRDLFVMAVTTLQLGNSDEAGRVFDQAEAKGWAYIEGDNWPSMSAHPARQSSLAQ